MWYGWQTASVKGARRTSEYYSYMTCILKEYKTAHTCLALQLPVWFILKKYIWNILWYEQADGCREKLLMHDA